VELARLIAYFVGFVVMIPFFSTGLYTGSVARALGGADVAMLVGLPVAALVYLLACRSFNIEHDRTGANRGRRSGAWRPGVTGRGRTRPAPQLLNQACGTASESRSSVQCQSDGRVRRYSTTTGSDNFQRRGSAYLRAILTSACRVSFVPERHLFIRFRSSVG